MDSVPLKRRVDCVSGSVSRGIRDGIGRRVRFPAFPAVVRDPHSRWIQRETHHFPRANIDRFSIAQRDRSSTGTVHATESSAMRTAPFPGAVQLAGVVRGRLRVNLGPPHASIQWSPGIVLPASTRRPVVPFVGWRPSSPAEGGPFQAPATRAWRIRDFSSVGRLADRSLHNEP